MSQNAITVSSLNYYYPDKKALENITIQIPKGEITALVGPNGAGKSTLMRCLAGLDSPFSGEISICGIDIINNPRQGHSKLGYLSDDFGLYEELTVKDVLEYMAGCHELPIKDSVDTVIKRLKIESVQDKKCGALSRGWKQRVGIAMAVIHMPEVLILDEPASGLDPEARSELSTILKDLQKEGMTILVSSHILSELEEYSTAMLVLRDGKIKDHITLEQQKALTSISSVHIGLSSPVTPAQKIHLENLSQDKKISVTENRHTVTIQHKNEPEQLNILLKSLLDENIPVCSFTPSQSTLQTLYLEIAQTDKNQDK